MSTVTTDTLQLVVFGLVDNETKKREDYGVGIDQVQEIRVLDTITRIPKAPAYVRGVTNLRGKIISVIDVKQKLGFKFDEVKSGSRILVAEIGGMLTGLLVDEVDQVMRISVNDIEAPPSGTSESNLYVKGVAKTNDKLIIILDLQKLLQDIDVKSERG